MTTTTVKEQAALADAESNSAEAVAGPRVSLELKTPEPHKNVHATKEQLPFSHRELRAAGDLLALQIASVIHDFEKKTGARIRGVSQDVLDDKIRVTVYDADNNYVF